jgi:hypothetical protein
MASVHGHHPKVTFLDYKLEGVSNQSYELEVIYSTVPIVPSLPIEGTSHGLALDKGLRRAMNVSP